MDRGTLLEVWDGSWNTLAGPGPVGGPTEMSGMGRENLVGSGTGWGTREEFWDGSGDPRGGPGQI